MAVEDASLTTKQKELILHVGRTPKTSDRTCAEHINNCRGIPLNRYNSRHWIP